MGTPQQFSLKWNNYSQHIVTAFEDLRGDDDLTDVTLSCEGKRIKAHKVLLSACSVYFKETFRDNPCKHPVVILKGVSFADLQAVVTFMYNGQVNVSQERLNSFLQTAELLQIKGLTDMNDQEEATPKKRSHSVSSGDPVITNVSHSKGSVDDPQEIVTPARPPTPKRKRIGPASFMQQQQQLLSQQNDSQVPSSNQGGSSSSTTSASAAGPSSVSSSTGGLLNPETVILPSLEGSSNSGENFSHGIIKFEEEEVLDDDDDYEKNNLSEDNDSSMHDMLGSVEHDQNSLGSYIAGSSGTQPIKILTGGQDSTVHVKQQRGERRGGAAGMQSQQQRKLKEEVGGGVEELKPPHLKQKVFPATAKMSSNRFLKTDPKKVVTPSAKASNLESEPKKEATVEKKESVVPALKQLKRDEGRESVAPTTNGNAEVDVKGEQKEKREKEELPEEDLQAEQIRVRFQQEEFMSRLDLLRNHPPNVPITLPSLRPIPKLQRGAQNFNNSSSTSTSPSSSSSGSTTTTTNCSSGSVSTRNFSSSTAAATGGLSHHNFSFSTPNFSISQQLLRSAKATARAKEHARSLSAIPDGRRSSSSSLKLSTAVGKGILHGTAAAAAAAGSANNKAIYSKSKTMSMEDLNASALADSGGPFVCDLCGKRYVHHRSLNDHKKFHTGATTCQYCNKAFSKVANLRAHMLAQHKDNGHDGYLHV